jgi:hypothetical protein
MENVPTPRGETILELFSLAPTKGNGEDVCGAIDLTARQAGNSFSVVFSTSTIESDSSSSSDLSSGFAVLGGLATFVAFTFLAGVECVEL